MSSKFVYAVALFTGGYMSRPNFHLYPIGSRNAVTWTSQQQLKTKTEVKMIDTHEKKNTVVGYSLF